MAEPKYKNVHVVIFSTLFAVVLWLFINMSYEYQTVVSVPLVLENMKPGRALVRPIPPTVNVKLRTSGWRLVGLYFVPDIRYVLDVGDISSRFNFVTNKDLLERLKLPQDMHSVDIKPDTLTVVLDEKIRKTVPLEPVVHMNFREGYGVVGDIRTMPDSVTLTGARTILDKIDRWQTETLTFTNLKAGVNTRVQVSDTLSFGVAPFPTIVTVQFDIQPTAEKTLKGIPVEVNQVPANRLVVLIPPKIDIIVRGGIEAVAAADRKDFASYVDYKSILLDTTGSIQPVVSTPRNIRVVHQDPERLQYVVRK